MAMEIKSPPVLRGREAREFREKIANFTDNTSREEAQASFRATKAFLAKYYNPYKDVAVEK